MSCIRFLNAPPDPIREASVQARVWLGQNLRDPSSLEIIQEQPIGVNGKDVALMVQYRARNGFGGMSVETKIFMIRDGEVSSIRDFP